MKVLTETSRADVYNAPIIPWDTKTYTPVSNRFILDLMDEQMKELGLTLHKESYLASRTQGGAVKGVIGAYDIMTSDKDFGQRVMFRNSYDKSMSFAMVVGSVVWICSNGCISGTFQYKRMHRGAIEGNNSTTITAVKDNIIGGFDVAQRAFEHNKHQLDNMREIKVDYKLAYEIIGTLFFNLKVLSINQMSIINKEFSGSQNFNHLGDPKFTAYDLYNHITESLKVSHPLTYFSDHMRTHDLFENTFKL